MVLSVAAMVVPSLAHYVHTPAAAHEKTLSLIVSVVLLVLFALTLPASLRKGPSGDSEASSEAGSHTEPPRWPVWLAVGLLALAAAGAAFVSDWFVVALEPAMDALSISDAFAGLVIVGDRGQRHRERRRGAAGRPEPVRVRLLHRDQLADPDRARPRPAAGGAVGGVRFASLTLVFAPMLVVSVVIAVILTAFITFDGESTWIEGAALIAVYAVIATSFWWG